MTIIDTAEPQAQHNNTDAARAEELAFRIVGAVTAGNELLTIELGRRLGLYAALFEAGPSTSIQFAAATGLTERYAREWLEQQAAAGIVDVVTPSSNPTQREFLLPAAHVPVLLLEEHPLHLVGGAQFFAATAERLTDIEAAYRDGEGLGFDAYGAGVREGIASINRPGFVHGIEHWVRSLPDVAALLEAGGRTVLDAGCGVGWSTIGLAKAFPLARIVGIDLDDASIVQARINAREAGVGDRVTFAKANASNPREVQLATGDAVTLVTIFEALHDMGNPVGALRSLAQTLTLDGAILVADEAVSDEFSGAADERDRLAYAFSVLHCLPATIAESDAVATGTVIRSSTVHGFAREAGLESSDLPIEHLFWNFYRMN